MKRFISKVKKATRDFFTNKSAFSLVELIVVIAIMAVMAAVLAPALLGYVEKSRAQKDDSALNEVTNAVHLSLADAEIYDEILQASVKDNYSCYCDGDLSTNTNKNSIIIKSLNKTINHLWYYNDQARLLDETVYKPSGKMRGATITFKPNGSAEYILKEGIINQIGNDSTKKGSFAGKTLEDVGFEGLYNRLRSTIGDTIKVSSQTYRNSDYTIFISLGTTGGNQADKQDAIQVWGQFNGTNLSEVASGEYINSDTQVILPSQTTKTLEDYTWEEIQQIAIGNKTTEYNLKVGDTKSVVVNGERRWVRIIGINHDGTGTITFMFTGRMFSNQKMSEWATGLGGWESSRMRQWLNSDVIIEGADGYIKPVTKYTDNNAKNSPVITETVDRLFLLSVNELGMLDCVKSHMNDYPYVNILQQEGTTYEYFQNDAPNKIYQICNGNNYGAWWSRSPDSRTSESFFINMGTCVQSWAGYYGYVAIPAFVIG